MNLQMEIGKSSKYPTKKTINLAMYDTKQMSARNTIIAVVAVVIVVGLVLKFGVFDMFDKVDAAEASYQAVHAQNAEYLSTLEGYADVEKEYRLYSRNWYSGEEGVEIVSRQEVLDMIESQLMTWGTVKNVNVTNNVCTADMSGMTLSEISLMIEQLKVYPIVESAQLNLAESADESGKYADFNITINLKIAEEEVE